MEELPPEQKSQRNLEMAPSGERGSLLAGGTGAGEPEDKWPESRPEGPARAGGLEQKVAVAEKATPAWSLGVGGRLGRARRWTVLVCDSRDRQRIRNEPLWGPQESWSRRGAPPPTRAPPQAQRCGPRPRRAVSVSGWKGGVACKARSRRSVPHWKDTRYPRTRSVSSWSFWPGPERRLSGFRAHQPAWPSFECPSANRLGEAACFPKSCSNDFVTW